MDTVLSAFLKQLDDAPDYVAIVHDTNTVTYEDLARLSLVVADHLISKGMTRGNTVALVCERSIHAIAAMSGVMLCGCTFVPIDKSFPDQRIDYMLKDASVACVITDDEQSMRLKGFCSEKDISFILLSELASYNTNTVASTHSHTATNRQITANFKQLYQQIPDVERAIAYIMYTSGSTGTPKGVPISHRALHTYCKADAQVYRLKKNDRTLQFSTLSFDICIEEIFPPLTTGSTVVLRPSTRSDHQIELSAVIEGFEITAVHLATGYWHEWVDLMCTSDAKVPACLRLMVVTGEKVSVEHYQRWLTRTSHQVLWANAYGPTEATVSATVFIPPKGWTGSAIPIGKTLPGYTSHILNAELEPVNDGETGELCIGGPALAEGYLNRPEQTQKAFIVDRFSDSEGARLYRTGDLAYLLPGGDIHYAGRLDHQIKLGSYRIEPGEIENAINIYEDVAESIVTVHERANISVLVAYIASTNRFLTDKKIATHLKAMLPAYMLPVSYVLLEKLPKTLNGKIDREALPDPALFSASQVPQVNAPQSPVEDTLSGIWKDVLGISQISVNDNFVSLGGDSLIAVRAIARIQKELGFSISTRDFFFKDTIALQASHISGQVIERQHSLQKVQFINTRGNQLYTVTLKPMHEHDNGQGILLVPPLGNEHRRIQRPFRNLMRQWVQQGYTVQRFDWRGIGNSSGNAECVTDPQIWFDDLHDVVSHFSQCVEKMDVISFRMGGLLTAHASLDNPSIRNTVYWDPVLDGKRWLVEMRSLQKDILSDTYRFLYARKPAKKPDSIEELNELRLHSSMTSAISQLSFFNNGNQSSIDDSGKLVTILLAESDDTLKTAIKRQFPLAQIVALKESNDWTNARTTTIDMVVLRGARYLAKNLF